MAKPRNFIAGIFLNPETRHSLLKLCPPRFQRVYASRVTLAYNVPRHYRLPKGNVLVAVKAIIETDTFQSLLVTVNGSYVRPDGKLYHITMSVPHDVPPAEAGNIDEQLVEEVGRFLHPAFQFTGRAKLVPRMVMPWQERDLIAA